MKLSRPLKTAQGVPCGRTENGEGGRTAPDVRHVKRWRKTPLYWRLIFSVKFCAIFHSAWAEDRATVGTNPSADSGAKTEGGRSALPAAFLHLRDWHQCDKSRGSGGWPPGAENTASSASSKRIFFKTPPSPSIIKLPPDFATDVPFEAMIGLGTIATLQTARRKRPRYTRPTPAFARWRSGPPFPYPYLWLSSLRTNVARRGLGTNASPRSRANVARSTDRAW